MSFLLNPFRFVAAPPPAGTPPTFHSISAFNVSGVSASAAWQTGHAIDDVGLLFTVVRKDQPDATDFASLGWTDLGLGAPSGANSRRLRALWKRATSTSEPNVTMDDSGALNGICLMAVRGCRTSGGAPAALLSDQSGSGASNQVTIPSGTTSGANRLVAVAVTLPDDTDTSQLVSFVNANLSSITTRIASQSSFGVGAGLYVFTAEKAVAAALLDTIMNVVGTAPDFHAGVFEFIP